MVRRLYNGLWYLGLPIAFLRLFWRSRKAPAYRKRLLERVGVVSKPLDKGGVWVHAVSVGEVMAAVPVIKRFTENYPNLPVTVTTMTPTGSERVTSIFGNRVQHIYLPYDVAGAVNRFLSRVQPKIGVIIETELWPNLFHACNNRNIPIIVANARLSEKSKNGYSKVKAITKVVFDNLKLVIAQSDSDAERFKQLGLPEDKVAVSGSIKYDIDISENVIKEAFTLRNEIGNRPIFIAASTHQGEDTKVLRAFKKLKEKIPELLLIIVPRHPERFNEVARLCEDAGNKVVRRSEGEIPRQETNVYVGDTMGELKQLYAVSDVAFVAGSFKPVGGHNILEPIALDVATVVGPFMFNFAEINKQMLAANGIKQVKDEHELSDVVYELLSDASHRRTMVKKAAQVLQQNKGALDTLWRLLEQELKTSV